MSCLGNSNLDEGGLQAPQVRLGEIMKICSRCKQEKDEAEFYLRKNRKSGYLSACKLCLKIEQKKYRGKYKDYHLQYAKRYREKNRDLCNKKSEKNRNTNRAGWLEYFKKRYSNIPVCQICGKTLKWHGNGTISEVAHFDHKKVDLPIIAPGTFIAVKICTPENIAIWEACNFGILCNICNSNLLVKNRVKWLESALKYAKNG